MPFSLWQNTCGNMKPLVLISHLSHCNIIAVLAKKMVEGSSKLILVEQSALPKDDLLLGIKEKFVIWMMRRLHGGSNVVVAVSKSTARNIENKLGLEKGTVRCIYNPVVNEEMVKKSKEILPHAWFEQKEIPVFLAAGRLEHQKDFETLLKAFAMIRQQQPARLIILGEGSLRNKLEQYISVLGINRDVSMPGFTVNPYSYMKHADTFVLSSVYEGLPTVLIEAMACGCAVVATDCPEGPSEILENGIYGMLVPVGNAAALAQIAMDQTLKMKKDKEKCCRWQGQALFFLSKDQYRLTPGFGQGDHWCP